MCPEWRTSFSAFIAHIGARPPGMSIDRIDNNRGYEPGNVRWASPLEQSQNSRRPKLNADAVREIRRRHASGETMKSIADSFSMTPVNVRWVVRGVTWKHVARETP
jgi:hypothetical protein